MKYSYALLGMILFGMTGLVFIVLFEAITINNESEYYTLKETTQAAMYDSIDLSYYRINGKLKISEQKFIENFTKRFANNILGDVQKYELKFYDIMESPPKVTVVVNGQTSSFNLTENNNSFDIINNLTAILGYDNENRICNSYETDEYYYSYVPIYNYNDPALSGSPSRSPNCGSEEGEDDLVCEIGNVNRWNINSNGQIIMPYIFNDGNNDDNNSYTYTYVPLYTSLTLYEPTDGAKDLYDSFATACGYPLYRDGTGNFTYEECKNMLISESDNNDNVIEPLDLSPNDNLIEIPSANVKIDYIEKLNKDNDNNGYYYSNNGTNISIKINYSTSGVGEIDEIDINEEYMKRLYVIKWSGSVPYTEDFQAKFKDVILGINIHWGVTKCEK